MLLARNQEGQLKLIVISIEPYKDIKDDTLPVFMFAGNVSQSKDKSGQFTSDKIKKVKLIWHKDYGAALAIQYLNCLATASIGQDCCSR